MPWFSGTFPRAGDHVKTRASGKRLGCGIVHGKKEDEGGSEFDVWDRDGEEEEEAPS